MNTDLFMKYVSASDAKYDWEEDTSWSKSFSEQLKRKLFEYEPKDWDSYQNSNNSRIDWSKITYTYNEPEFTESLYYGWRDFATTDTPVKKATQPRLPDSYPVGDIDALLFSEEVK